MVILEGWVFVMSKVSLYFQFSWPTIGVLSLDVCFESAPTTCEGLDVEFRVQATSEFPS